MRWESGLAIPIEPKKEWKDWMCDYDYVCPLTKDKCKACALSCSQCIYSYRNSKRRARFYNSCFPSKPRTLPKRDSKGRFCKKEQKGGIGEYFRGLQVPVKPKKDWDWMLDREQYCDIDKCDPEKMCKSCVYSHSNADTRALFFTKSFKDVKKKNERPGRMALRLEVYSKRRPSI